jgi:hypothetical protein
MDSDQFANADERKREIARLQQQIERDYDAAERARRGAIACSSHHAFIAARMKNMDECYKQLAKLTGGRKGIKQGGD